MRFRLTSLTAGHFPTMEYIRCIIRRRNVFMKLEISVKFIDENGMEATKPVTVDTSVPDFDNFHDVNDFLLIFYQLEKAGLRLRNESFSTALAQYMETMSKKTARAAKYPKTASYVMESEAGRLQLHLFTSPGSPSVFHSRQNTLFNQCHRHSSEYQSSLAHAYHNPVSTLYLHLCHYWSFQP